MSNAPTIDNCWSAVPDALKALPQWVVWKLETHKGKPTKVPYMMDGKHASHGDPSTWTTFENVASVADKFSGIGFVFAKGGGLVGIDIDDGIDEDGKFKPWAQAILAKFSTTYAERSPSLRGVKVFASGSVPGGRGCRRNWQDGAVEIYGELRYFTVTGDRMPGAPSEIIDCQRQIDELYKLVRSPATPRSPAPTSPASADDQIIINKLLSEKSGKAARLWSGDTSGYLSHSEADAALVCKLVFYCGADANRIDQLFRQSALCRDKWERQDYRGDTIASAIALTTERYDWSKSSKRHRGLTAKSGGGFHLTDLGNAERLVAQHGADLRYCRAWGKWLVWDDRRWTPDETGEVERRAKLTVRSIYAEAARVEDSRDREAIADHAKRSESESRIGDMIRLAQTEAGIALSPKQLDSDPWVLNVLNGVVDLRTGELKPHDRNLLITKMAPVEFDPDAKLEMFDQFLITATGGNQAVMDFLQRATGYSLCGDTREEKLFFVHGPGASGKSTFIEAIKAVLGDYAATADFETFLQRQQSGGARGDIARLAGARFVTSIEVDDGKRLAEGLVKQLTGGDTVTARYLYRDEFEFRPAFKLWLVANHAPKVRDDDDATWRRILRIPFNHVVPEEERDPKVKATLTDPAKAGPAILAWAVRGCLEWQRINLAVPVEVLMATAEYRADMDPLREFMDENCEVHPDAQVLSVDLYRAYKVWCEGNGQRFPLRQSTLIDRLASKGFERGQFGMARLRGLKGLALREHTRTPEHQIPETFHSARTREKFTENDVQVFGGVQTVADDLGYGCSDVPKEGQ